MIGRIRRGAGVVALLSCGLLVLGPTPAAYAEEDEDGCATGVAENSIAAENKTGVAWPQEDLQPHRAWPLAKGRGVTVAVLDSGVQADHPLLEGKVKEGKAYLGANPQDGGEGKGDTSDNGMEDCIGHGTAVAGIIAGGKADGDSGFYGLAPKAKILPVRVANQPPEENAESSEDAEDGGDKPDVDESDVADAIDWAVEQDADVINLSLKYDQDFDVLKDAVNHALDEGVVVVAAGGNEGEEQTVDDPKTPYPAAYEGVIGVGAVDRTFNKTTFSQWGDWIDVVAPGSQDLVSLQRDDQFNAVFGGTSGATAYVSATAALLKERYPDWTPEQIHDQITGTASPTPGGNGGREGRTEEYGYGMIDPYRAVTADLNENAEPVELPNMQDPDMGDGYAQAVDDIASTKSWSLWLGLGGLLVFFGALAGVAALRRGRSKGWRVKKADKDDQIQTFDDGDPIPFYQGIKGLKR
ncbi:MAG: type VII secretion-associated serine protease mycosin [Stackebrandtia sp.]